MQDGVSANDPRRPWGPQVPAGAVRPPWWLITSWVWWGWFTLLNPALLGWSAIGRLRRSGEWSDVLLVVLLGACVVFGIVQLVLSLLAYRRDPALRQRKWPPPPTSQGFSRRVTAMTATMAILVLGLVLLIFVGWAPALFVTLVLGGVAFVIVRFNLFSGDTPPLGATEPLPRPEENPGPPDR